MRATVAFVALLLLLPGIPAPAATSSVDVHDAWIREAPPGARVWAAYLDLANNGDLPVRLVAAESGAVSRIEIHQTTYHDGMARMRPVAAIELAPGERLNFGRSGHHLMLFLEGSVPHERGGSIPLTLRFDGAPSLEVEAVVRPGAGSAEGVE